MMNMELEQGALAEPLDDAIRPSWKAVYTIAERNGRKHWVRIGIAFVNRDGSYNVRLDAVPVNGSLHIRDASPRELPAGRDLDGPYGNA
jgi:hypothetical protein